MGKGVLIISEIEMVLWKKAFKYKKIHCYTTSLLSSSSVELYFFFKTLVLEAHTKEQWNLVSETFDGGIVLVE